MAAIKTLLEREHLHAHAIDDEVAAKALDLILERVDPGKLLLLAAHVRGLQLRAHALDDEFRAGDFRTSRQIQGLIDTQRKLVAAKVDVLLNEPLNLKDDEYLEADPDKRTWAADEAALIDRWRRLLENQVLERIVRMDDLAEMIERNKKKAASEPARGNPGAALKLAPPPATFEAREARAREELRKSYSGRFSRLLQTEALDAAEVFVNAFAGAYDPHSLYMAPSEKEDFDILISGSLEGIGAVLSEDDHYILVREIVPGGAAWRQGKLEEGDLILAVAQVNEEPVDVADMRIDEVVRMIRGPKGTNVILTIKKPDGRVLNIEITRDLVIVEATYAQGAVLRLGGQHEPAGYISLPSFYGNTRASPGETPQRTATADVGALLSRFTKQGVQSVVLDLRRNGGGLLDQATGITGLFIDQGPVVEVVNGRGQQQLLEDTDRGVSFGGQVVILVDSFSASASEILAGALQDYGRALIVGTGHTHGKGTVQALIDLDRVRGQRSLPLGVVKLTVQQFFLVDGESTQWRGVVPDVALEDPFAHLQTGERYLKNAIPFSEVAPLIPEPLTGPWDKEALAQKSQQRQAQEPFFAKVRERREYLKKREENSRIPLSYQAFMAQHKSDREILHKFDLELKDAPARFTIQTVSYRAATMDKKAGAAEETRLQNWTEALARDPWVEETLRLVEDMRRLPSE